MAPVNERTDRRSPLVIVHSSTQQRPVGDQHGVCDPPRAHAPSSAGRVGREVVGGQAIDGKVDWKTTPPSSPAAIDDETARRGSPCDLRSTTYYDRGRENPFDPPVSRNSARKRIASRFEVVGAEDLVRRPRNEGSSPSLHESVGCSLFLSRTASTRSNGLLVDFRRNAAPRKHPSGPHIACQ